jgi:hypothetical protein
MDIVTEPFGPKTSMGAERNERHARKVARVAEQLRRRTSKAPLSRQKRVVSHRVPKVHDKRYTDEKIDVSVKVTA